MGRTRAGMAMSRTITCAGLPRTILAIAVSVGMARTTLGAVWMAVAVTQPVFAMGSVAPRSARVIRARPTAFTAGALTERPFTMRTRVRRTVIVAPYRMAFALATFATTFTAAFVGAGILQTIAFGTMAIAPIWPTALGYQCTFSSERMESTTLTATGF